jgi:hypothetical protein
MLSAQYYTVWGKLLFIDDNKQWATSLLIPACALYFNEQWWLYLIPLDLCLVSVPTYEFSNSFNLISC